MLLSLRFTSGQAAAARGTARFRETVPPHRPRPAGFSCGFRLLGPYRGENPSRQERCERVRERRRMRSHLSARGALHSSWPLLYSASWRSPPAELEPTTYGSKNFRGRVNRGRESKVRAGSEERNRLRRLAVQLQAVRADDNALHEEAQVVLRERCGGGECEVAPIWRTDLTACPFARLVSDANAAPCR